MSDLSLNISIITLEVSSLNTLIKRQRLTEWILPRPGKFSELQE